MDNFKVAMTYRMCPICGAKMDGEIIMNTRLTKKAAKQVEELDGKIVGISENVCDECLKHKDDIIFIVKKHSEFIGPSGTYVGISSDNKFFEANEKFIITSKNGAKFMYVDSEAFDFLMSNVNNAK